MYTDKSTGVTDDNVQFQGRRDITGTGYIYLFLGRPKDGLD